jgi:hypothetical protein
MGMMFLDTGKDPAPVAAWIAQNNLVVHNHRARGDSEEAPATSGVGVAILGGQAIRVRRNVVVDNAPGGDSFVTGGIVVVSAQPFGGADAADNRVTANLALGNKPVDVNADGATSDNAFRRNVCRTSTPAGLCALTPGR